MNTQKVLKGPLIMTSSDSMNQAAPMIESGSFNLDVAHLAELGVSLDSALTAQTKTLPLRDVYFSGNGNTKLGSVTDINLTLVRADLPYRPYYRMWLTVTFVRRSAGWGIDLRDWNNVAKVTFNLLDENGGVLDYFTNFGYDSTRPGGAPEFKVMCSDGEGYPTNYKVDNLFPDYFDLFRDASMHVTTATWYKCP